MSLKTETELTQIVTMNMIFCNFCIILLLNICICKCFSYMILTTDVIGFDHVTNCTLIFQCNSKKRYLISQICLILFTWKWYVCSVWPDPFSQLQNNWKGQLILSKKHIRFKCFETIFLEIDDVICDTVRSGARAWCGSIDEIWLSSPVGVQ